MVIPRAAFCALPITCMVYDPGGVSVGDGAGGVDEVLVFGLLLVVLMLASGLSAYWNGREAADTAYDRTLLASARTFCQLYTGYFGRFIAGTG